MQLRAGGERGKSNRRIDDRSTSTQRWGKLAANAPTITPDSLLDHRPPPGQSRRTPRHFQMAPEEGLEPSTTRLTAACSTIELLWNPQGAQCKETRPNASTVYSPARWPHQYSHSMSCDRPQSHVTVMREMRSPSRLVSSLGSVAAPASPSPSGRRTEPLAAAGNTLESGLNDTAGRSAETTFKLKGRALDWPSADSAMSGLNRGFMGTLVRGRRQAWAGGRAP